MQCCEICCHAFEVFGLARPILICNKKFGCGDKFFVVWQNDTCKNFKAKRNLPIPGPPAVESDDVRFIPLTQGKFAIVDTEDYPRVSQYKWRCRLDGNKYYAYTFRYVKGRKKLLFMHRFILNAPKHNLVDHIDGNGLNNRKANLRLCNYNQNSWNRRPYSGCRSKYKGVYWNKEKKKWHAAIIKSYKRTHLGYFDSEIEAALAYNRKAKELFGEFAYLNFAKGRD